ncbi:carbohydrate sulfotransferase 5-like [Ambystoma mexicanum]|uniref:carbohydrate sulfotransferase 5-like n=1 Tax=Ambystoma mexicanum TaxID=8296 RepID=UPI0037E8423A
MISFRNKSRMLRRITVSRLCLFLAGTLLLLLWLTRWQLFHSHSGLESPSGSKHKHLLILSSWRSGSTFVGQLFNQNPSVFYLSEPAKAIWATMSDRSHSFLQQPMRDLLKALFLCNLSALKPYLTRSEFVSDIYDWSSSRALCSPPTCDKFQGLNLEAGQECYHVCHLTPFERAEKACLTYNHIVVKEVRFFDLKVLFPLLMDPQINLQIIHLVRDPRAILASRPITRGLKDDNNIISESYNSTGNIYTVMKKICNAQLNIYHTAVYDLPPSLMNRYVIVRYEDLMRDPMPYVKDWYKSMGLTVFPRLLSWVRHNTHWLLPKNGASLPSSKGSAILPELWRKKLNFQKVQIIQDMCQKEMDTFGYLKVKSEKEQLDRTLNVVLPRKDSWTE